MLSRPIKIRSSLHFMRTRSELLRQLAEVGGHLDSVGPLRSRIWEGSIVTPTTPIEVRHGGPAPLEAMAIVATQRQQLHEKILRLRALREASEASIAKDKKPRKK